MAEFCIAVRSAQLGIEWPFLSTNISQGSEATHLRSGGIFHYRFITNLLLSVSVKNRSAFGNVSGKNIVAPFFGHSVYTRLCRLPLMWSIFTHITLSFCIMLSF